jgi:gas vesicle protein
VTAATGLLLLAWGFGTGAVIGAIVGYLTRDREARAEIRHIRACLDAHLARIQAELETGDGLAEADDFARWSAELREEAS